MHEQIAAFIKANNFDYKTNSMGVVNEGKSLLKYLEDHEEKDVLVDIESYGIYASNGNVRLFKGRTRTYINVGKFSNYYHSNCYLHYQLDKDGRVTGSEFWIVEDKLDKPSVSFFDGKAEGELCMLAALSDEKKSSIIESAKRTVLEKCRDHFGRW